MALACLPFLLFACGGDGEGEGAGQAPVPVEATVAIRDTLTVSVRAVGSLEAQALVDVRAEGDGRVSRILFREGSPVKRGEALVLLEQGKLQAELEAARAAEVRARAEATNLARQLERNRGLLETGAISQQAFDDLQAAHDAAQARLEEARASVSLARQVLADATIRAPFTGRAGERRVDLGDYVQEGDPLLALVDDDSLEIGFSVPERYVARLEPGSSVVLRVASHPDRTFEGAVSFVSPVVDPVNRSVRLKARVGNTGGELRAGQFANVVLGLERRADAVLVPEAAIVPRAGESFVFLVKSGQATERPVRIGERSRGIVEIADGVAAGDTVIVAGQQKVREGTPVAPEIRPVRELEVETVGEPATAGGGGGEPDTSGLPANGGPATDDDGPAAGQAPAGDVPADTTES